MTQPGPIDVKIDSTHEEQIAHNVGPDRLNIAYQRFGSPSAPPLLMIMGGAAQMIHWPDAFCNMLAERGLQPIRFDNRDAGHSTHLVDAPDPNLPAALAGDFSSASYTLVDMAADTVGLLDALDIESAHILGASMGGQIAQIVATNFPSRVRSLISLMSTTGNSSVGQVDPEILRTVFGGPPAVTRDEVIAHRAKAMGMMSTEKYPSDPDELIARATLAYDRGHDEKGLARQAVATVATGDRTEALRSVRAPTLVIHGTADRMCHVSGGRTTAEAIPSAKLVLIEDMGHSLAPGLRPILADHIADFVQGVDSARLSASEQAKAVHILRYLVF